MSPTTFGPAFNETIDGTRLTQQHERIKDLMLDGTWRTLRLSRGQHKRPAPTLTKRSLWLLM